MNVENFKRLREHVANNPDFYMDAFRHPCGSAACIVGSAEVLMLSEGYVTDDRYWSIKNEPLYVARTDMCEWLGVTYGQYEHLMTGNFSVRGMSEISKQEAVDFLDRCIEAGHYIMEWPRTGTAQRYYP